MTIAFRARPKPFLDPPRREWQFDTFAWLLRHCGGYPQFLEGLPVLPTPEHFPDPGMKGHAGVSALFRCVRDHAGMAEWPCMVEPAASGNDDAAAGPAASAIRVIRYEPGRSPSWLVAHFARELARFLVDTFDEPPPGGRELLAPAVDLAAIFMGFGVFMANAAADTRGSALNETERVHALAMYSLLRMTPAESLASYLNPHLRKYLRLAVLDLARYDAAFRRLRAEAVTRAGDSAVSPDTKVSG